MERIIAKSDATGARYHVRVTPEEYREYVRIKEEKPEIDDLSALQEALNPESKQR